MGSANLRELRNRHMLQSAIPETEKKIVSILKVLSESSEPLGSITIARELERHGIFMSERTVRYHLRITDERGFTRPLGADGRMLTPRGFEELRVALAPDQVGFILERIELLAFRTTFDPATATGLVGINTSLMDSGKLKKALNAMKDAFQAGMCVSDRIAVAFGGEKLGDVAIPDGKVGIATVCAATINGVLLKAGIPIETRFGGVLEIQDRAARRFVAVIYYSGTSLDPSEQYIRARMTSVGEAARTGNGRILANFREAPAASRSVIDERVARLKEAGIGGVCMVGNTSEPACQIGVGLNRVGVVLLGGLNPIAAAVEAGVEIDSIAESGMIDFAQLTKYSEV
ncbi:MAG: NrpR regulatory domain-containing protein [Chloroflexota bacterium]|nr:NrpR regulatory domain-containing protein [Chloroflexota bacterium]